MEEAAIQNSNRSIEQNPSNNNATNPTDETNQQDEGQHIDVSTLIWCFPWPVDPKLIT